MVTLERGALPRRWHETRKELVDYNDPFRAKEVPLSIDEEAHLRAPENRVVVLTSSEFQDSGNVLRLQAEIIPEDLVVFRARRQEVEHILHAHT